MIYNNIESKIANFSHEFEKKLLDLIPKTQHFSDKLNKAMSYVIRVGGKRLRPILVDEISSILIG